MAKACERYVVDLRARKGERPAKDVEGKINKHVMPVLAGTLVSDLSADAPPATYSLESARLPYIGSGRTCHGGAEWPSSQVSADAAQRVVE